jgi:twitching motility protein PilT
MRDRETVNATFQAALTGHLVLTTLHTLDVVRTINRVVDFYPETMQQQARIMLSETVRSIISMRLLPAIGGGRIPAMEIMKSTGRIREWIIDAEKTELIKLAMEEGEDDGMVTFDRYLLKLFKEGKITYETALNAATSPHDFKLLEQKETDFTDKVLHRVEQFQNTGGTEPTGGI